MNLYLMARLPSGSILTPPEINPPFWSKLVTLSILGTDMGNPILIHYMFQIGLLSAYLRINMGHLHIESNPRRDKSQNTTCGMDNCTKPLLQQKLFNLCIGPNILNTTFEYIWPKKYVTYLKKAPHFNFYIRTFISPNRPVSI